MKRRCLTSTFDSPDAVIQKRVEERGLVSGGALGKDCAFGSRLGWHVRSRLAFSVESRVAVLQSH